MEDTNFDKIREDYIKRKILCDLILNILCAALWSAIGIMRIILFQREIISTDIWANALMLFLSGYFFCYFLLYSIKYFFKYRESRTGTQDKEENSNKE